MVSIIKSSKEQYNWHKMMQLDNLSRYVLLLFQEQIFYLKRLEKMFLVRINKYYVGNLDTIKIFTK